MMFLSAISPEIIGKSYLVLLHRQAGTRLFDQSNSNLLQIRKSTKIVYVLYFTELLANEITGFFIYRSSGRINGLF